MSERVLVFPDDLTVGSWTAMRDGVQVATGPARGSVRMPAGADVVLRPCSPVRGLANLAPDDIHAVETFKKITTDTDLARLAHLTGLRVLGCSKAHPVTDRGLATIASLRNLRDLDLYFTGVTDRGLPHLAGMVQLERLHLGLTRVKGPGLRCLAGLQRLQWISLEETDVDDAVVTSLAALPSLRRIALWGTRLSTRGLAELQSALPSAQISMRDPGRRLARERARAAIVRILARRLRPDLPEHASAEEALRALLPDGSCLVEWRLAPWMPRRVNLPLTDLDVVARWLPRMPLGADLRIVTPAGLDVWIPWLRPRRGDRRRTLAPVEPPRTFPTR